MFDPEKEKKAEASRKRQKEMFARMNRGAPTLHDQMRAQAVGQSQQIADKLDRSYEMGTILGMDVHKANARRVSEGRDRQADVIRELIRANAETEKERLRLETAKVMAQQGGLADLKAMNRMG